MQVLWPQTRHRTVTYTDYKTLSATPVIAEWPSSPSSKSPRPLSNVPITANALPLCTAESLPKILSGALIPTENMHFFAKIRVLLDTQPYMASSLLPNKISGVALGAPSKCPGNVPEG